MIRFVRGLAAVASRLACSMIVGSSEDTGVDASWGNGDCLFVGSGLWSWYVIFDLIDVRLVRGLIGFDEVSQTSGIKGWIGRAWFRVVKVLCMCAPDSLKIKQTVNSIIYLDSKLGE